MKHRLIISGKRPKCPECKSSNITSKGDGWSCKDCGRWFLKKPRGRMTKDYPDRPKKCPYCGCKKVWSNSDRWKCSACYKDWSKKLIPRRKDLGPRPPCPECGAPEPISEGGKWKDRKSVV